MASRRAEGERANCRRSRLLFRVVTVLELATMVASTAGVDKVPKSVGKRPQH